MLLYIELSEIPPMVIAIWSGKTKPLINEYLKTFVLELRDVLSRGIQINSHRIKIKLGLFIADTPARSLLKGMHA